MLCFARLSLSYLGADLSTKTGKRNFWILNHLLALCALGHPLEVIYDDDLARAMWATKWPVVTRLKEHLEGSCGGRQHRGLLGEQARELRARLCELSGDGILPRQSQISCWEAERPVCRPAGTCTLQRQSTSKPGVCSASDKQTGSVQTTQTSRRWGMRMHRDIFDIGGLYVMSQLPMAWAVSGCPHLDPC